MLMWAKKIRAPIPLHLLLLNLKLSSSTYVHGSVSYTIPVSYTEVSLSQQPVLLSLCKQVPPYHLLSSTRLRAPPCLSPPALNVLAYC